jgi:hypothetical protein
LARFLAMIDPHQRHLILKSFDHVRPVKQEAGERFYRRLFILSPAWNHCSRAFRS